MQLPEKNVLKDMKGVKGLKKRLAMVSVKTRLS
jgi:hypothetical protein